MGKFDKRFKHRTAIIVSVAGDEMRVGSISVKARFCFVGQFEQTMPKTIWVCLKLSKS